MADDFGKSAPGETLLGGYRLLRRLAVGSRATILLGLAPRSSVPVALKLFHAETPVESIDRELGALTIFSGAHMVELQDVQRAEGTPTILVFERLRPGFGPGLDALTVGQASTLLVPIIRTIARVHAAGLAHTALRPSAIGIDAAGRPMITGWGHAIRQDHSGFEAACSADRRALSALAHLSARMTTEPGERAQLAQLAGTLEQTHSAEGLDDLAESLIDRMPPRPLGEGPALSLGVFEAATTPSTAPAEAHGLGHDAVLAAPSEAPVGGTSSAAFRLRRALERWPFRRSMMTVWAALIARTSRRSRMIAGAAGAGILLAAILSWPSASSAPGGSPPPSPMQSGPPPAAALSDEPAEAALQLLELRAQCLREQSVLCLESAEDLSSALFLDDQRRMGDQAAAARLTDVGSAWDSATLIEREGDAALIDLHREGSESTASALLIHQSDGWRLRALLPAAPVQ